MTSTGNFDAEEQQNRSSSLYPPLHQVSHPLRSSLRSTPHYSAGNLREYARDKDEASRIIDINDFSRVPVEGPRVDGTGRVDPVTSSTFGASAPPRTEGSRQKHQAPSRIDFLSTDLLAGINLAPPEELQKKRVIGGDNRGPRLLELRRLGIASDDVWEEDSASRPHYKERKMLEMKPIAYSCSNPSFGMSLASTCLQVQPRALNDTAHPSEVGTVRIVTGLTTGALCLHSFSTKSEAVSADDYVDDGIDHEDPQIDWPASVSMDLYHATPRFHRPATAVAWSLKQQQHVAIGMVGPNHHPTVAGTVASQHHGGLTTPPSASGSSIAFGQPQPGLRSATPTSTFQRQSSGASGDREYCCYLWDIEHQQQQSQPMTMAGGSAQPAGRGRGFKSTTPLFKLSYQMGVASLGWVLEDGQTLAVGGQLRNLQLYDLRVGSSQQQHQQTPLVSVYAHNFGVHGIESDPFRPWQFATFCRAAGEPVKIWDARMMDSMVSEIKLTGQGDGHDVNINHNTSTVIAVKWSATEAGIIAVAANDIVHEYDTATSAARPVHFKSTYLQDSVLDFCLYPFKSNITSGKERKVSRIMTEISSNRLFTVSGERKLKDVARHTWAPLAISPRDGRIVHGFGRTLWIDSPSEGPAAMESLQIQSDEDVSSTMMRRARCQHVAKYSMVASANIRVLAEDGLVAESMSSLPARAALLRLWSWIERVEALCSESTETENSWASDIAWQARGLTDAGAWRLIEEGNGDEVEVHNEQLACVTFESPSRRAALTSCGWVGKFSLANVIGECEELDEYERAASLAVWHGNIEAAVATLERGAEEIRRRGRDKGRVDPLASQKLLSYAETLELGALCIAGYRGGDVNSPAAEVWRRSCAKLLQRDSLATPHRSSGQVAYLRAILSFLTNIGLKTNYAVILWNASISLCDRVGFACRFLPRDKLVTFLDECIENCKASGDIEGVTVTGLDKQGIAIIQSYVDKYSDVQTAALVTSRVLFPSEYTHEKRICEEWLDSYRSLLNSWQMWQSRAMFDVDRADLLRQVRARQGLGGDASKQSMKPSSSQGLSSTRNRNISASHNRKPHGPRPMDPFIHSGLPCQLEARCNFCNSPLGLKSQDTHASQWLSRMKPVLTCCPQCRKPLPRCAICLLSLGTLNPYMELTKDRSRNASRGGSAGATATGDLSSLANLPFGEWFSWCMRCKHGGHAHHLVGWFAKHETCPVSGCNCSCQFDGIQKLNRPALSQRANSARLSHDER